MKRNGTLAIAVLAALLSGGRARADLDLWPLLEISDESTTVLYPLFVREGKFLMIFPLFYRTNEGRDHHFAWPVVKWSDGELERLAPFWFRGEESFTLLPIVRRTPEYTAWLVPPLYVDRQRPRHGVFPLYLKAEHDFWALPTWHSRWADDGSRSHTLWPLLARERSPGADELRVLWRLFGWEHHDEERAYFAAYVLNRESGPDRWWNLVFPVFSNYLERDERGFYLFPYYQERGPDLHTTGLVPVFEYRRKGDESRLWLAPFYRSRSPRHSTDVFFPLYVARTRHDANEVSSSWWLFWPLYQRSEQRDSAGQLLERYRRFGIFSDQLERDGSRVFSVLGIAISERTPPRRTPL